MQPPHEDPRVRYFGSGYSCTNTHYSHMRCCVSATCQANGSLSHSLDKLNGSEQSHHIRVTENFPGSFVLTFVGTVHMYVHSYIFSIAEIFNKK